MAKRFREEFIQRDIVEELQHMVDNCCPGGTTIQLHILHAPGRLASSEERNVLPNPQEEMVDQRLGEESAYGSVFELPDEWVVGPCVVKLFGEASLYGSKPQSRNIMGEITTTRVNPVEVRPFDAKAHRDAAAFVREVLAMEEINKKLRVVREDRPFSSMIDKGYWLSMTHDHTGKTWWVVQLGIVFERIEGDTLKKLYHLKCPAFKVAPVSGIWWDSIRTLWVNESREVAYTPIPLVWFFLRVALDMCSPMELLRAETIPDPLTETTLRSRPIAHMDIKEDNIMIGPSGLTIIDMGISVFVQPIEFMGKMSYDAPYGARDPRVFANAWCKAPELFIRNGMRPSGHSYSLQTDMFIWGSMLLYMWSANYQRQPFIQNANEKKLEEMYRVYGVFLTGRLVDPANADATVITASSGDAQLSQIPASVRSKGFAASSCYCFEYSLVQTQVNAAAHELRGATTDEERYERQQEYEASILLSKIVTGLRAPYAVDRLTPRGVAQLISNFMADGIHGEYRRRMIDAAYNR